MRSALVPGGGMSSKNFKRLAAFRRCSRRRVEPSSSSCSYSLRLVPEDRGGDGRARAPSRDTAVDSSSADAHEPASWRRMRSDIGSFSQFVLTLRSILAGVLTTDSRRFSQAETGRSTLRGVTSIACGLNSIAARGTRGESPHLADSTNFSMSWNSSCRALDVF